MTSQKKYKINKIVLEILKTSSGRYSINGIDLEKSKFLYREPQGMYIDLAHGDYTIDESGGTKTLIITNSEINTKLESIQVAYVYDFTATKYETDFNVDINILKDRYNVLVENTELLWEEIRKQGFVADGLNFDIILPQLDTGEVWVKTEDGWRGFNIGDIEKNIADFWDKFYKQTQLIIDEINKISDQKIQDINQATTDGINNINNNTLDKIQELEQFTEEKIKEINEQGLKLLVNQVNHGFLFTPVQYDSETQTYKQANYTNYADGIAVKIDDNSFYLVNNGFVEIPEEARDSKGNEYVEDNYYFLDNNGCTPDKPTQFFQTLFLVVNKNGVKNALVEVGNPIDLQPRVLVDEVNDMNLALYNQVVLSEPTIQDLVNNSYRYEIGDVVEVLGYYTKDDGATHKRVIAESDNGSGVLLASRKYANIIHNGIVNVDWYGAKGDGVLDDTEAFKKALKQPNQQVQYPYGSMVVNLSNNKRYIITQPIELLKGFNCIVNGNNARVYSKITNDFVFKVLNSGWGSKVKIQNMRMYGSYTAYGGILIEHGDSWVLDNVWIREFKVGVSLKETYYGEFCNSCRMDKCLTGIELQPYGEINTIKFNNTSCSILQSDMEIYNPKLPNESDYNYHKRVPSYGIKIGCDVQGLPITGVICEGFSYGIYGKVEIAGTGGYNPFIQIKDSYFEHNFLAPICLDNNFEPNLVRSNWKAEITGNRIWGNNKEVIVSGTDITYRNNQKSTLFLKYCQNQDMTLYTDLPNSSINLGEFKNNQKFLHVISDNNRWVDKDEKFHIGYTGFEKYVKDTEYLKSYEDNSYEILPTCQKKDEIAMAYKIKSITTKPLTFVDFGGVVQKDTNETNVFYITKISNGKQIVDKITNKQMIFRDTRCQPNGWFKLNISKLNEEEIFVCQETGREVLKRNGILVDRISGIKAYGGANEYANINPPAGTYFNPIVYNHEIGITYYWMNSYWALCSTSCYKTHARTRARAIGTTAQRPELTWEKSWFIYFNTDTQKYEMFKNGVWEDWDFVRRWDYEETTATSNNTSTINLMSLDTPYMTEKMKSEGVYSDFVSYMDAEIKYNQDMKTRENSINNFNRVYSRNSDIEKPAYNNLVKPKPSERLLEFAKKYL